MSVDYDNPTTLIQLFQKYFIIMQIHVKYIITLFFFFKQAADTSLSLISFGVLTKVSEQNHKYS